MGDELIERENPIEATDSPIEEFEFDPDRYRQYLDAPDLTTEEENEILGALFFILQRFVEMGFSVDPTQLALGQLFQDADEYKVIEPAGTKKKG